MLIPPMVGIAERENWTLAAFVKSACPWQDGIYRFTGTTCLARQADLRNRIIPKLDPDVVVLIGAPLDHEGKQAFISAGPADHSRLDLRPPYGQSMRQPTRRSPGSARTVATSS